MIEIRHIQLMRLLVGLGLAVWGLCSDSSLVVFGCLVVGFSFFKKFENEFLRHYIHLSLTYIMWGL